MKQIFIEYLKNQLSQDEKLKSMNSIAEEDKVILDEHIASLTSTIEAIEALEDTAVSQEVVDELKASLETLNQTVQAIKEKIITTKKEEPEMENIENYLKTQNAVHDFAQVVRTSKNGLEFKKNWESMLSQNGITIASGSEEYFLPEIVKGKIQDVWDRNADWLKDLKILNGVKRYTIRKNDSTQTDETSRAKGHKKGDTKVGQSLQFSGKIVTCQFIYKLAEISVQDEWDDETVVDYIVNELVDMILYEEKRAILVGDGRANDSDYKITSIEAIAKSSTDAYTYVATETANGFLIDDLVSLVSNLHNDNNKDVYMFMSKADLNSLRRVVASDSSTPVYLAAEQVAEMIGVSKIITTNLLGESYKALCMIPDEYVLIGANVLSPVLYTWHEGYKNLDVTRYECAVGGAIEGLLSTAVLKANA